MSFPVIVFLFIVLLIMFLVIFRLLPLLIVWLYRSAIALFLWLITR